MADENWNKAKRIFAEVIKIAPDEARRVFWTKFVADDADTRREVESLLASLDDAGNFMETPAIGEVADSIAGETAQLERRSIHRALRNYRKNRRGRNGRSLSGKGYAS